MGLFRVLWMVTKNWHHAQFRRALRKFISDWQKLEIGKGEVIAPETIRAKSRRPQTEMFHFSAPEKGERRNMDRTGTFMLTAEELDAELVRQGRKPGGPPKRPE